MNDLFQEFSPCTAEEWKAQLSKDLKGINFEDLSQSDRNGITIRPFYTDTNSYPAPIIQHNDWCILSKIVVNNNEASANKSALYELQNGASGLIFEFNAAVDFETLLRDIEIQYIQLRFEFKTKLPNIIIDWHNYIKSQNIDPESLHFTILSDPLSKLICGENIQQNQEKEHFKHTCLASGCMAIDTKIYQNAGANSVYQLALAIGQTNEYLNWAEQGGYLNSIKKINVAISNGTDFFEEIAKLRALRILLQNLIAAYHLDACVEIHTETSDSYRSPFDAYNNLLRDSLAAMSAVIGGCNSLFIHPFDQSLNDSNDFSKRMSRNQQIILKEESYLHQIADASAGSFYIEKLSEELGTNAWAQFQEMEKNGGWMVAFEKQQIQNEIKHQAANWIEQYKSGQRVLIGINKFVNPNDPPKKPENYQQQQGLQLVKLYEAIL